tara:strand:+ start:853 stop:2382 length:1530 start_codon:yes stop_codon:yes gene_type:complete
MIVVTAPDGSAVNFPDGTSHSTINDVMMKQFAPEAENSISGSAKSLGVGLAEGTIGLAGFPADAADFATRGFDYLAGTKSNESVAPFAEKYGAGGLKKMVEGYTGEFRNPQTVTEKYLQTVGSFWAAAIGGPAGLASRVATRAVIPGLASEAAGQLTEGTAAEPYARVAGALGGAVAGGRVAQAINKPKIAAVPAGDELNALTKTAYGAPELKSTTINPTIIEKIADRAAAIPRGQYMEAPTVYKTLDMMKAPMNGPAHSVMDVKNVISRLGEISTAPTVTRTEQAAAAMARGYIERVLPHLGKLPGAIISGDVKTAASALRTATKTSAVEFRNKKVADVLEQARNTAGATHSGANLENEIYKQVRSLLNPKTIKKNLAGWTPDEIAALRAVLPGVGASALRRGSKLLGGGGGLGQMVSGGAGGAMFGWPGMAALPALGMGANRLGSTLAESRLNKVGELLRSRSPSYGAANQAAYQQSLQGGGILGSLPPAQQAALQALLATRGQPVN